MPTYYYRTIGNQLAKDLCQRLARGESAVLLGPAGVGKRYAVEVVNDLRERRKLPKLAIAGFGGATVLMSEEAVAQELGVACGLGDNLATFESWQRGVMTSATEHTPILLAATNVDGMTKSLAHRFLSTVSLLVKTRRLVVLATGECNLYDLVDDGPTSAWECAHQYVVHAHDKVHFHRFLAKRMAQYGLCFPANRSETRKLFERMYELTGGDVSLLRAILWSVTDSFNFHLRRPEQLPVVLKASDLPKHLGKEHVVPTAGLVPFLHATQCIFSAAQEPYPSEHSRRRSDDLLRTLEDLLADKEVVFNYDQPHTLELAGLVQRDERRRLKWSSLYIREFAHQFFTTQRMGDLHAFAHEWPQAFASYARISNFEEKRRPLSEADSVTLMRLIDGLAIDFHRRVREFVEPKSPADSAQLLRELQDGLTQALQHLLGFAPNKIAFWTIDLTGKWTSSSPAAMPPGLLNDLGRLWEVGSQPSAEENWSGHHDDSGVHWVVCRDSDDRAVSAVLVDGSDDPLFYHHIRRAAIHRVFRAYRRARERFVTNEGLRIAARHRAAEADMTRAFWKLTSASSWKPEEALGYIAKPLLENLLSVRRLVFVSFDATNGIPIVKPIYDSANGAPPPQQRDFQPVAKAFLRKLVDGPVAVFTPEEANILLGQANLPLFSHRSVALRHQLVKGFLLVEARDEGGLRRSDLEFLRTMAERMKKEWDQALRLSLLHESLNAVHTPTVLLDSRGRIIFANKPVIEKLCLNQIEAGWQAAPREINDLTNSDQVRHALTASENQGTRVEDLTQSMRGTWLRECHRVKDTRGWVLIFRNRAFLFGAFELMRKIEAAQDGTKALQLIAANTINLLGMTSAKLRVYALDNARPNLLVSRYAAGMSIDGEQMFADGKFSYEDLPGSISWAAIHSKEPKVFRLTADPELHGVTGRTQFGLEYLNVNNCEHRVELEKKAGDVWIDLPLVSGSRTLGKLTIAFSEAEVETLLPDTKELIKALSVVLGDLLGRIAREAERNAEREVHTQQAMAQTAHGLWSHVAALDTFIFNYQLLESELPALTKLNRELTLFRKDAFESLQRIKDLQGPIVLRPEPGDLREIISTSLNWMLKGERMWSWTPGSLPAVLGRWDAKLWRRIFTEIAHNSLFFVKPETPLRVTVDITHKNSSLGRNLEIVYRDNGRGVPPAIKDKIFHGARDRAGMGSSGQGQGLSYVRRVCEAENGMVREQGEYLSGVEIVITIPVHHHHHASHQ